MMDTNDKTTNQTREKQEQPSIVPNATTSFSEFDEEGEGGPVGSDPLHQDGRKPRRWLYDRCDGKEMVMNPRSRPCAPCFYAPLLMKCFPDIMEQNCVMEFLGKIGLFKPTNIRARRAIMIIALLSTIVGWSFLIFADFAISTKYGFVDAAAFNTGSISFNRCRGWGECDTNTNSTRYSLGLKAIAFTRYTFSPGSMTANYHDAEYERIVTTFDDFCDGDLGFAFVAPEDCQRCEDASSAMVISILMSTITYFFTFTTDVLRIWPNYDVNCQKVFGAFFAIFSAVMGVQTWVIFRNQCFQSFKRGNYCYNSMLEEIDCDDDNDEFFIQVYFHWQAGPGLLSLGIATFAKVLDLLCNLVIPTPTITRNNEEQWEYERLAEAKDCNDDEEEVEKEEMDSGDSHEGQEEPQAASTTNTLGHAASSAVDSDLESEEHQPFEA